MSKSLAKLAYNGSKASEKITIEKVFPFRSDLKRMSTICNIEGFDTVKGKYALVKGAPEVVNKFIKNVKKPKNLNSKKDPSFDATASKLMKEGYRVLCLAYKKLEGQTKDLERDEIEKGLVYGGLLILSCPLKNDTA